MRVVIDTNIVVSSFGKADTPPRQIIELWKDGRIELLTCEQSLSELARVLRYQRVQKLTGLSDAQIGQFVAIYALDSTRIELHEITATQSLDASDNVYLTLADVGNAEFLVTGDTKHLLPLETYQQCRIVTARAFMNDILHASRPQDDIAADDID